MIPTHFQVPRAACRRGVASVLAMLYLVLFSTLAVGFYAATNTLMVTTDNYRRIAEARLAAESGMEFIRFNLAMINLPPNTPQDQLFGAVYDQLSSMMNNTGNLGTNSIGTDGSVIYIPEGADQTIPLGDGTTRFRARIIDNGQKLSVIVNGFGPDGLKRSIQMDYAIAQRASAIFNYGVASKSAISMNGNVSIRGATDPADGSVLSATYSTNTPLVMVGSSSISGDVSLVNPDAGISVSSSSSIAGTTDPLSYNDHVHKGVEPPEFPLIDTTAFAPYATGTINTSNPSGKFYNNIRIKANTNPSFQANTVITGVVYIESPNHVSFAGNLSLQGVIVTQTDPVGTPADNSITFGGTVSYSGVQTLPSGFGDLRKLTGAMLLAPNFTVDFQGNFGTVGGSIIGSKISFSGNSGGTVTGSVINLDDTAMSFSGSSDIIIQSQGTRDYPAGVKFGSNFVPLTDTWQEIHE